MPSKRQRPQKVASSSTGHAEEERAFLSALIENVEDDTTRLVYADWLEENDDPNRAEFIRLQIELAPLEEVDRRIHTAKKAGTSPRHRELLKREEELLDLYSSDWRSALPTWTKETLCEFKRGFVARVSTSAARFLRGGAALCRVTPLEELELIGVQTKAEQLASFPWLACLRKLFVSDGLVYDEGIRKLLESPHLVNLTTLELGYSNTLGTAGAEAIARSPALTKLTSLDLASNAIGTEGVRALVGSPSLQGLSSLNLANNGIDLEGILILATNAPTPLRVLHLPANSMGDEGASALAASPRLANLSWLCLGRSEIGIEGIRSLAGSRSLSGLTYLNLSSNPIGSQGARLLAESPCLNRLTTLLLMNCDLGDGLAPLRERFGNALQC